MQNRLTNHFKSILKGIIISLLLILLKSVPSYAEAGDLKINNQVIYEKNEESQSHSNTFKMNQLFMKDMSDQDEKLIKEQMELLANAQKAVFVKETPKELTVDQQITPTLFSKDYILHDSLDSSESRLEKEHHLGFIFFCTVGGLVVLSLGILLGKSFPTWLKKG